MYSPLQVLSCYSLLQSTIDIKTYVSEAKKLGYQALALTDLNVMYGVLDFYEECKKQNIKPIIGLTIQLEDGQLVLLAKNLQGYHNLLKISSLKMIQEEALSLDQIVAYLNNLYVILPTQNSPISELVQLGQQDSAQSWLMKLKQHVDENSLLIGISTSTNERYLEQLKELTLKMQLRLVFASPVHYLKAGDYFKTMIVQAIKKQQVLSQTALDARRWGRHYLYAPDEIFKRCQEKNLVEAYQNVIEIVNQIDLELKFSDVQLPKFTVPEGVNSQQYLKKLCYEGLKVRLNAGLSMDITQYQIRLDYELSVIHQMGFDDYFLIVWDITNFAHQHQIRIGPGRGSAAGSLVSYCLFISDVDPLKYQLLFERFLNPKRAQMPDIDLDIPDRKRADVLKYVHQKYGHQKTAQIITFGTLAAKQAIRDVARVMGQTTLQQNKWSAALSKALNDNDTRTLIGCQNHYAIKRLFDEDPINELIFNTAQQIEGLPRHYSIHAAGVVLSDHDLSDVIPVQASTDGMLLTQFAKKQVEKVGLLKMDLLGLRNLTLLDDTLQIVLNNYDASFNITRINLNDQKTLALFENADTDGVFQFESDGIKQLLVRLKPSCFEDIVAANALYRPGPMENIGEFIARKHGQKPIVYYDKLLEPILASTYGIIVYQEQVMQVVAKLAGFDLSEADILRRAISSKDDELLAKIKQRFISGAVKHNVEQKVAEQIYEYIAKFGGYGFNRSHSVAYSKLAFELAYLKTYYPAAFFTALLNTNSSDKTKKYLSEIKQRKIKVFPPSINQSQGYFTLRNNSIYFGLKNIKTLSFNFIVTILSERKHHGKFKSLADFMQRLDKKFLKEDQIEALIYSGAFDEFKQSRSELLAAYPGILSNIELSGDSIELFKMLAPKQNKQVQILSQEFLLEKEAHYLGTYISSYPTENFKNLASKFNVCPIALLKANQEAYILLYPKSLKEIRTKKGDLMAFLHGSDASCELDVTIFPRQYQQFKDILAAKQVLLIRGKVEPRERLTLIAQHIELAKETTMEKLYIRIPPNFVDKEVLQTTLRNFSGSTQVIVYDVASDSKFLLNKNLSVKISKELLARLKHILGSENVVVR